VLHVELRINAVHQLNGQSNLMLSARHKFASSTHSRRTRRHSDNKSCGILSWIL